MPLWICLQEKAHVPGEIYQRRELSARAAFFFVDGGSINQTRLDIYMPGPRAGPIQTPLLYISATIGNEAANKPATVSGMTRGLVPHPMIRRATVGRLAGSWVRRPNSHLTSRVLFLISNPNRDIFQ